MNEPTCATCPWWSRFPACVEYGAVPADTEPETRTPNDKGECRKLPPLYPHTFPMTELDDWCGEHPDRKLRSQPA